MPVTNRVKFACLFLLAGHAPCAVPRVLHDSATQSWRLTSGPVEYRLRQAGDSVCLDYFGPTGKPPWPAVAGQALPYDISGLAEGQGLGPEDLRLSAAETRGDSQLALHYRHRRLALEIEALYSVEGESGVITRRLTLSNRGGAAIHVESLPALAWRLPPGRYELTYLWGGWGQERQLAFNEEFQSGRRVLLSDRGRSTNGYSPWFALRNDSLGTLYLAQLAWSGNWLMSFDRAPGADRTRPDQLPLSAQLGMRFDFGGALALEPGTSFALPAVAFTATGGDLDDGTNHLHRYQRSLLPHRPAGDPLLVQFNSWYPFGDNINAAELKRAAERAAQLGIEVFIVDSGWYNKSDWSRELGDYQVNRVKFPNGLEEVSNYVRAKGMKFGLWVEIENVGVDSALARAHPGWLLSYNGAPIVKDQRQQLDFSKLEVRQWARATLDRLIRDYGLGWIKIDYNVDIGERFDPPGSTRRGDTLYRHVTGYYGWLDELRATHPGLVVENCSSGGLRFDLGILAHTHTTWLSDVVTPRESAQLAYGCTVEFPPQVCNHWMVGDDDHGRVDAVQPPGWWDFLFRIPMNGQFGISSRLADWSPALRRRAAENVAAYKRIRTVIENADVFHLTPQPSHDDPSGWMAIQYVSPGAERSTVLAYRLGRSLPRQSFKLRGLAQPRYEVTEDGKPAGTFTARELATNGLPVELDAEWRSALLELTAVQ